MTFSKNREIIICVSNEKLRKVNGVFKLFKKNCLKILYTIINDNNCQKREK